MEYPAETPKFRVTLVHGTWAGTAAWTKDGSVLRTQLEATLRDRGGLEYTEPLSWTGRNVHEDRRQASLDLLPLIRTGLADTQISVVIAHSHGGNIALKTLGMAPDLCDRAVVVTLATPFLQFMPQRPDLLLMPLAIVGVRSKLTTPFDIILWPAISFAKDIWKDFCQKGWRAQAYLAGILAILAVGYLATAAVVYRFFLRPIRQAPGTIASFLCRLALDVQGCEQAPFWLSVYIAFTMVVGGSVIFLVDSFVDARRKAGPELDRIQKTAIAKFQYFQPDEPVRHIQLFVMSSSIDEALGALSGSWWWHRANIWVARLIGVLSILVAVIMAASAAYFTVAFLQSANLGDVSSELAVAIAGLFGIACLSMVLAIVKVTGFVATRLALWLGLGLDDDQAGLLTNVKAFRRPPNIDHMARKYGFFQLREQASGLLTHSLLYNHYGAIQDMADWIVTASTKLSVRTGL